MKELRLEINKRCNYSCVHCYTDKVLDESLPLQTYLKSIDEAVLLGANNISLTGGEPLLQQNKVLDLAKYAAERGMKVRLNTNGHLLTEERCKRLVEAGLYEVQISLNGDCSENFDEFTQVKGSFEKVINAVKTAVSMVPIVTVRFTLMSSTAHYLISTFKLVESLGVHNFKVRTLVQASGIHEELDDVILMKLRNASQELFQYAEGSSVKLRFSDNGLGFSIPTKDNIGPLECLCGHGSLFVSAEGNITACPFVRDYETAKLGNANVDSLVDVFQTVNENPDFRFKKYKAENGCVKCAASTFVLEAE
ncbi:MAG: radical SAM protein [Paenibacillus dendritiformis]|uniref:radical SAM protein n=1 Tax=uncultured Paenibacillus sp. TaxID=227322 RepID=UPI0025DF3E84|nr:radical SAM protein [uncultured Paenibacillus sp.]MDU5143718.1 radical SAM protein [Paenibacillus dendritiformis]